jgi:hypothetical protein
MGGFQPHNATQQRCSTASPLACHAQHGQAIVCMSHPFIDGLADSATEAFPLSPSGPGREISASMRGNSN